MNLYPLIVARGWTPDFADSCSTFRADGRRGSLRLLVQQNHAFEGTYLAFVALVTSTATRINGVWCAVEERIGESGVGCAPDAAIDAAVNRAREWIAARAKELP